MKDDCDEFQATPLQWPSGLLETLQKYVEPFVNLDGYLRGREMSRVFCSAAGRILPGSGYGCAVRMVKKTGNALDHLGMTE